MVFRVYVEKKPQLANEAEAVKNEIVSLLGIHGLSSLRIVNRYDVENIDKELFEYSKKTVFSEPQLDIVTDTLDTENSIVFAVEYLPGQFDQRADSAAQCIQIISTGERPAVRSARVYLFGGDISDEQLKRIKKHLINPVECREAALDLPDTLAVSCDIPTGVRTLHGFISLSDEELKEFIDEYSLAMDLDDIRFCRSYFQSEHRDPTETEIRMLDTYWSDHCRHTTFLTTIDSVSFEDALAQKTYEDYLAVRKSLGRTKPVCLMDIATVGAGYLKAQGKLSKLDESEEINACTVKITVSIDGKDEPWLLLFKNETHNHPTEIEPFGGAATCIGGAIRDPLSGRAYVYSAMRVTGAADPTVPPEKTIKGKLPQRKIVTTAAAGYSSYGNQIGLATGLVDEIYHSGYAAKRMEIGAVIAAAPERNVRRETPEPGDSVVMLGGRTGRDGCGGATGSSKSHTLSSLEQCGAEVQKGNAPEERKLQRLFRNAEAARLIKRCNDFGAGGVSVAIGELADGLDINLDCVAKKYEGLDGTELAISESQERMAVVVAPGDAQRFIELANAENLEAAVVAKVKEEKRLTMMFCGKTIVDVSREFLNSNGAPKHTSAAVKAPQPFEKAVKGDFAEEYTSLLSDLNVCSKRGLSERFDSTIGAGAVMMPFGGKYQRTPVQAMVTKISVENGHTDDCSLMSYGFNPFISEKSPYHGAYLAVVESLSKLVAAGADIKDVYLTFQEYFESPRLDPERWGKPLGALLGAFAAQRDFGVASIGGKDSMSGSFESIDVPPTLVSFAVTTAKTGDILSGEFKSKGSTVVLIKPEYTADKLPDAQSLLSVFETVASLNRQKKIKSAYTLTYGGIAEAVYKMCIGNGLGFDFDASLSPDDIFGYCYGGYLLELDGDSDTGVTVGTTTANNTLRYGDTALALPELNALYEGRLESVYPCNIDHGSREIPTLDYTDRPAASSPLIKAAKPQVLIPVFPGTNCEYDTAKALADAGARPEIFIVNNLTADSISQSVAEFSRRLREAQIVFIPGGFSGGDEPDGSGKFITAFFRNKAVESGVHELLNNRDGLMCGICNGFQALIKLGLVPYGRITDTDEKSPTLTYNTIARHQSKLVRVRVASAKSPWLSRVNVGDVFTVPISHGEGRFFADDEVIRALDQNGQIATQYVDLDGNPTADVQFNPNNSAYAIEGITSPDGRVFGKMGHCERIGDGLYKNVGGSFDMRIFESAVYYFA